MEQKNDSDNLLNSLKKIEREISLRERKIAILEQDTKRKDDRIEILEDQERKLREIAYLLNEKLKHFESSKQDGGDKVKFLLVKLKEKEKSEASHKSIIERMQKKDAEKNNLLVQLEQQIEKIGFENKKLLEKVHKDSQQIRLLVQKLDEKEFLAKKTIEKNEKLLEKLKNPLKKENVEKIDSLLEKLHEKNAMVNDLVTKLERKNLELNEKTNALNSISKQESEKQKLIAKLSLDLENILKLNKRLLEEAKETNFVLKTAAKKKADAESESVVMRKRVFTTEQKLDEVLKENERLKNSFDDWKKSYVDEQERLKEELKEKEETYSKEKTDYENKLKKTYKDLAKKEIEFKTKVEDLKGLIERQNYLILQKEKKEKEIVEEISAKFSEIFALRKEISTLAVEKENFNDFLGQDEFKEEEMINIKSLIRTGLAHNDALPDIKKSLAFAGFDPQKIETAAKEVEKEIKVKQN